MDGISLMKNDCSGILHSKAIEGMMLFNMGKFFEAHEELEDAWREERGDVRDLYRGVLQVAVVYLHITRGNYDGAVKVYERCIKWLRDWPDVCRGIQVEKLRNDLESVIGEVRRLGKENIRNFDQTMFKKVEWSEKRIWICDRCGTLMHEKNCKVSCPNCGNRFDCSDLNLYFD
jgi:predicted metal-dependent hydrolase